MLSILSSSVGKYITMYRYSRAIGMQEKSKRLIPQSDLPNWSDTKEKAIIANYWSELAIAEVELFDYQKKIKEKQEQIRMLEEEIKPLKEQFPEEFI